MYKDDGFIEEFYEEREKHLDIETRMKRMFIELRELTFYLHYIHELIPLKYKKINPGNGECPFFSARDFKYPDAEEIERCKKNMAECLRKYNEEVGPITHIQYKQS